ncbi:MAG TPA: MFS transporter [Bryobacteraceae bacterium]|nr:MFS transporter [Bryobacteraceae bacterium]
MTPNASASVAEKDQLAAGPSRLRWVMISLAFLATVINYLDRQTLSVVAPVITEQFRMSNVDYSRVVFAFMLAYTIMNGVSGPMVDRLGTKLGYAVCVGWWSIAAMLHALARGPLSLGVFRFLLGMGEAGNWPAGVKVVSEWFPPKERAFASGIFNSGSAIGAVIAPPLVAWIVLQSGWRSAFLIVGGAGLVWLVLWLMIYSTPANVRAEVAERPEPASKLFRSKWVCMFTISKIFSDPAWYFYIFWFPQYLKSARGFDLASIGKFAWIPFLTADAGNLIGGAFSAALLHIGVPAVRARKISVLFFAALMTSAIPAVLVSNVYVSIALISTATLGYTGALANMLAMPADRFPRNTVGSVWGIASMGAGFGGMVFSLLTGWVIDHYSYVPVFIGFGILPLIAAGIVWCLPEAKQERTADLTA